MSPTYAILYGFSENQHHAKEMEQFLQKDGFIKTTDAARADVVIAHSAGCYMLPGDMHAKLVVLIGVPMNKDKVRKTFFKAWRNDNVYQRQNKQFSKKLKLLSHNTATVIFHPAKQRTLVKLVATVNHEPPHIDVPELIVINNRDDPWPEPLLARQYTDTYRASFVSLPGGHDHIWQAPEEYVAIINYYAARLFT